MEASVHHMQKTASMLAQLFLPKSDTLVQKQQQMVKESIQYVNLSLTVKCEATPDILWSPSHGTYYVRTYVLYIVYMQCWITANLSEITAGSPMAGTPITQSNN